MDTTSFFFAIKVLMKQFHLQWDKFGCGKGKIKSGRRGICRSGSVLQVKLTMNHKVPASIKQQNYHFYSKIREMSAELKDRTCHLQSVMRHVLRNTSITEEMIDQGFLSDWEAEQQEVIEKEFEPALRQLENISTKCDSFAQNLMAIKPMQIRFDEEKLNALGLLKMSEHFNPQIDYDKLYRWFIDAMPELVNALYVKPPWSLSRLDRETQLMGHWLSRAHALMTRIDIITLEFPLDMDSKSKQKDVSHGALVNYWYESLMLTPAMKFPVKNDYRIKVWEAIPAMDSPIRKMQPNAVEVLSNSEDTSGEFYSTCHIKSREYSENHLMMK